jgi:uncharacterized protein (TIGR03382 family)
MHVALRLSFASLLAVVTAACAPSALDARGVDGKRRAIVGGENSSAAERPFQVSLQSPDGFAFCGGSLIAPDWVLTAQHCMEGTGTNDLIVVAGITQLSQSGQVKTVSQIVRASGFSSPENGKDVTLLRLSSPMTLSSTVAVIPTANAADVAEGATDPGQDATASGWGALSEWGQETPNTLQQVTVPIVSMSVAEQAYGDLTSDQLAAGEGGKDSCQGDSGGPLTVESSRGTVLAGVVSWGSGCGDPDFPGLYARVSAFEQFIAQALSGEAPDPGEEPADGWMCDPSWVGDGECDCGCGAPDSDCPDASIDSCQYNDCDFWQETQGLELDENDPSQCVGGSGSGDDVCPPNASVTPDGTACACNEGYEPNAQLTACVEIDDGTDPGEGEGEPGEGEGEGNGAGVQGDGGQRSDDEGGVSPGGDGGGCAATGAPTSALVLALFVLLRRRR